MSRFGNTQQMNLFTNLKTDVVETPLKVKYEKPVAVSSDGDTRYTEEYCTNYLKGAMYLWDMRAWKKYKDKDEVIEWVQKFRDGDGSHKNDGHSGFCIKKLIKHGWSDDSIADVILENKQIQYKYRLVPCMLPGVECKHWTNSKGYGGCPCEKCEKPQQEKIA